METNFLTAVDIAKILKISKALAYRLIANGEIRSIRFGRTVRVSQESLEAFLSRNSADSDGETDTTQTPNDLGQK